jgi:hypothetical protein
LVARRNLLSVALVLLGSLVCGLEITGRVCDWPQEYSALFDYDSETGYGNPHDRHIRVRSGDKHYELDFDAAGLLDRAGGDPDVIVVGDGVVAGVELPPEERISHLIAQRGMSGSVNLSVTGFGTLQQGIMLERFLAPLPVRPRTVILIFNLSNDLVDNIRDWEGTNIPGAWLSAPREILPPDSPSWPYRVLRAAYVRSYTLQGLRNFATKSNPSYADLVKPTPLPCIRSDPVTCDLVLATCAEAFKRLQRLTEKYQLEIVGLFWDHLDITPYPEAEITRMLRQIEDLAPFVKWIGRVGHMGCDKDWASCLAPGTRHCNAHCTRMIVHRVLDEMNTGNTALRATLNEREKP